MFQDKIELFSNVNITCAFIIGWKYSAYRNSSLKIRYTSFLKNETWNALYTEHILQKFTILDMNIRQWVWFYRRRFKICKKIFCYYMTKSMILRPLMMAFNQVTWKSEYDKSSLNRIKQVNISLLYCTSCLTILSREVRWITWWY